MLVETDRDVPAAEFRAAMGHFATGVTVVTSVDADGAPVELDGFQAWPGGWVDGIRICSGTNVLGIRTSPDEPPARLLVSPRT